MTTDHFPPSGGGVEVVIAEVAPRLAAAGHEVMVVTLSEPGDQGSGSYRGVLVEKVKGYRLNRLTGLEVRVSLEARRRMGDILARFSPHVVNAHHAFFTTTPIALATSRRLGIPSVLTLHIGDLDRFSGWRGLAARTYEKLFANRLIDRADSVIAVSRAIAAQVSSGKVTVVPNGVDLDRFHPSPTPTRTPRKVLFVGRLIANKGPDTMLRAFAEVASAFPDSSLTMVGEGPMRRSLERLAYDLQLEDRVEFLGYRPDVERAMRQSDIFVRPSLVEGMPLTILEAMASGLPVVASNLPGIEEVIANGESGLLVEPGSHAEVGAAILDLMRDHSLRNRVASRARFRIETAFSWDVTATRTEEALLNALKPSEPTSR